MKNELLPMPNVGKSIDITVRSKTPYSSRIICSIVGTKRTYDLWMTNVILKDIIRDLMKNNILIDDDMKCIIGRTFTITCEEWLEAPKNFYRLNNATNEYVAPKIYHASMKQSTTAP